MKNLIFSFLLYLLADAACARPLIFAHRGASGYRPEHTQAAYELAIVQGADAIEPDLVFSKDGVLVVRHENDISETTDVATRFPGRRMQKIIDGKTVDGWFTEDFTWAELQTLHARERLEDRDHRYDGLWPLLTFDQVLDIALKAQRTILVLPELKHPTYFRSLGFQPEEALAIVLKRRGIDTADSPVIVQSFEPTSLARLHTLSAVQKLFLIEDQGRPWDLQSSNDPRTYRDLTKPSELHLLRSYVEWIGPKKTLVQTCKVLGLFFASPTALVGDAHRAGLKVATWTARSEKRFVPFCHFGDMLREIRTLSTTGVDAVFTDHPDIVFQALRQN